MNCTPLIILSNISRGNVDAYKFNMNTNIQFEQHVYEFNWNTQNTCQFWFVLISSALPIANFKHMLAEIRICSLIPSADVFVLHKKMCLVCFLYIPVCLCVCLHVFYMVWMLFFAFKFTKKQTQSYIGRGRTAKGLVTCVPKQQAVSLLNWLVWCINNILLLWKDEV